jgi:hypothetical protein
MLPSGRIIRSVETVADLDGYLADVLTEGLVGGPA